MKHWEGRREGERGGEVGKRREGREGGEKVRGEGGKAGPQQQNNF